MTIQQTTAQFKQQLAGIYDNAEIDAMLRVVYEDVLHYSPVDVALRHDHEVPDFFPDTLRDIITRLQRHEPLQYILGTARFHGHTLTVTPATLIPRPETEQLVDMIVDENPASDLHVLDLGTGSGCIALALARALRFANVTGIDSSADALAVARLNSRRLKAAVDFRQADILCLDTLGDTTWDIIVSNPPYVTMSERDAMQDNVLRYEPAQALYVTDDNPLLYYKAIARYAATTLVGGGRLYLEINSRFPRQMEDLLNGEGFEHVRIVNDSFNQPRFATAQQP